MAAGDMPAFDPKAFCARHGGTTLCKHGKDRTLYAQGDAADCIFYIQKGKVELSVISEQGREAIIGVLGAGDFFGEGCLANQAARDSTATAMTDCAVARLDKATVVHALRADQAFSELFVSYLLSRNARLREDLIDQLFNSSEMRLARILLLLASEKEGREDSLIPEINQQTLAKMVGTTRSRINYFMNKFRRMGLIDYDGQITVHGALLNFVLRDQTAADERAIDGAA